MTEQTSIDRAAAETLAAVLLREIRLHYMTRPVGRDRVYEALNALAATVAPILAGTGGDIKAARLWFDAALDRQLQDLAR